ncbi:MAG TPA: hypothetical protein DCS93_11785 [Microscillaceae bacterium]|nr:hypothetical protein [Microscillaceae bacterium]
MIMGFTTILISNILHIVLQGRWLFTFLLVLLMQTTPATAQNKWEIALEWANSYKHFQPRQCLKIVDHILRRDSTQAEAYYIKARIIIEWGWWREAIQCYNEALRYRPEWSKDKLLMGQKHMAELNSKAYPEALATADTLIKHYPKTTEYYEDKATIYQYQRQYTQSLEWWDKVIALDPNKCKYHVEKAYVYKLLENYSSALQEYQLALKKSPLDSEAEPERYRQYIKDMQTNLQYRTDEQRKQAKLNKKIALVTAKIKVKPEDYDLYWDRALIYDRAGRHQEAIQDYNHILTLDTSKMSQEEYFRVLQQKARNERTIGLYKQALESISVPLKASNYASTFLSSRHFLYYFAGEYDKALADVEMLLKREPKNGIYMAARADTKRKMGDYLGALQDYKAADKLGNPGIPADIQECKAKAGIIFNREAKSELRHLLIIKDLDTLLARLDTYQQQHPQEKLIYYYRALTYAQYHKYDLARAAFQKALEMAPEYQKDFDFMWARAQNLHHGKYYPEALQAYKDIQKNIVGHGGDTSWQMGKIYQEMEDYQNAYVQFSIGIQMAKDPDLKIAIYYERAILYLQDLEYYDKALKDLNIIKKTNPGLAQTALAETQEMLNMLKEADELEEQLKNPAVKHRDSLLVKRARLLYEASYYGAAWKDFEAAVKINPDLMSDLDFAFYWAETGQLGKIKYPEVIEILKKAIALHPKDDDLLALLGRVYLATKQYQKSVEAYDVMINQTQQLDDYIEVMAERGKAKVGLKDYEGAWKDFMAYLEDYPSMEYFIEKELKICREKLNKD